MEEQEKQPEQQLDNQTVGKKENKKRTTRKKPKKKPAKKKSELKKPIVKNKVKKAKDRELYNKLLTRKQHNIRNLLLLDSVFKEISHCKSVIYSIFSVIDEQDTELRELCLNYLEALSGIGEKHKEFRTKRLMILAKIEDDLDDMKLSDAAKTIIKFKDQK